MAVRCLSENPGAIYPGCRLPQARKHVRVVQPSESRISPVVAGDYSPAMLATALACHLETRIRLRQCVVVGQLFAFSDFPSRNEVPAVVESYVPVARMIEIPLRRDAIKIQTFRRYESVWRSDAERIDFLLNVLIELRKTLPRDNALVVFLSDSLGDALIGGDRIDGEDTDAIDRRGP